MEQHQDSDFENLTATRVSTNLVLRSPAYLNSLDTSVLKERRDPEALKSLIFGVNTFMKKPDNYNNRMPWYYACANTSCNKKVDENATECHSCTTTFSAPVPRYLMRLGLKNREEVI